MLEGLANVAVTVALLRAVNVGGTGPLPMATLREVCTACGCKDVRTYIQSGNALFDSDLGEAALTALLERALAAATGRTVGILIRTAAALRATLDANPFPRALPAQVGVVFLRVTCPPDLLTGLSIPGREEVYPRGREIFVHYPDGMGRSKLKLPAAAAGGTARNMNTVAKLVALAGA